LGKVTEERKRRNTIVPVSGVPVSEQKEKLRIALRAVHISGARQRKKTRRNGTGKSKPFVGKIPDRNIREGSAFSTRVNTFATESMRGRQKGDVEIMFARRVSGECQKLFPRGDSYMVTLCAEVAKKKRGGGQRTGRIATRSICTEAVGRAVVNTAEKRHAAKERIFCSEMRI